MAATVAMQNRQRRIPLRLPWLRAVAQAALPRCQASPGPGEKLLAELAEVEVALVSDRTIARVHQQFMGLPEPTDVITFAHGEIVISAETAQSRAGEFGHSVEAEIALYLVHGLLHLNGFDDQTPAEFSRMHRVQDRLWQECLAACSPPE